MKKTILICVLGFLSPAVLIAAPTTASAKSELAAEAQDVFIVTTKGGG